MTKIICDWETCSYNKNGYCKKEKIKLDSYELDNDEVPSFLICRDWTILGGTLTKDEIKIIKFKSDEIVDSFAKKMSKLMTDITWGVKQGKSFEVMVKEVEDEYQPNPKNT